MLPNKEFDMVSIETLNTYFLGKSVGEKITFKNIRCAQCGDIIDIEIHKTAAGYGFLNGIISKPSKDQIIALCSLCAGKKRGK